MFDSKKTRVVVVDDDAEVLRTLKKILLRRRYEIFAFDSPIAALEHLRKEKADLILSDMKMPQMDGLQFLIQAKTLQPTTPFILITGYATIDTAVSAIQWGAFDYLRKPFEVKKIYEVIDLALKQEGSAS